MKCPKCDGKGFTELEHGLIMVECDECGGTGEVDFGEEDLSAYYEEANALADALLPLSSSGEIDGSSIGTEPDNQPVGGQNPSKPKQPRKQKKSKRATKKSRKVV